MRFKTINIQNESGEQAIRIPESHKINDDKVYVKRLGNALYLIPFHNLFESLDKFTPDFMEDRNQPQEQKREAFD